MSERAIETLRKIDIILDAKKFHHGPECRRCEGVDYYFCECGLKDLERIRLEEIKPLLKDHIKVVKNTDEPHEENGFGD